MPDTSLDDFIGGEGSAGEGEQGEEAVRVDPESGEEAAAEVDSAESEDETVAGDRDAFDDGEQSVEPAVSTYDFSPEGAPCAACGASVEKRWRAEAGLVCPGCKEW